MMLTPIAPAADADVLLGEVSQRRGPLHSNHPNWTRTGTYQEHFARVSPFLGGEANGGGVLGHRIALGCDEHRCQGEKFWLFCSSMKGDNTIIHFGRRRPMLRANSGSSWRRGRPFGSWPWGARPYLTVIALIGVLTAANLLGYGREFPTFADMFRYPGGGAQLAATGIIETSAKVIDGDTLYIAGQRVRLHGIDAPESAQKCKDAKGGEYRCGQEATAALANRIGQQPISCKGTDIDRYGRIIAVCRLGAEDINAWMVSQGWAMAYRNYSLDYVSEEGQARAAGRGIWRGEFTPPWDWRTSQRDEPDRQVTSPRSTSQDSATAGGCRIKGNISSKGERIYHVPGGRWYDPTRIDLGAGERWFCTETEARAAGWRPAKQ